MDDLSSASAVFAVISAAVQLAKTIHRLVEFWKVVHDISYNISSFSQDLDTKPRNNAASLFLTSLMKL